MALGPRAASHAPTRLLIGALAGGLPLLLASATAGTEPGWGDAGRALTGALALGGEVSPLSQWWFRLVTLVPLGPLALRAALASALALAVAAAAIALAVDAIARAQGVGVPAAAALALAAAWLALTLPEVWPAAVAPCPDALALALAALALERLCAHELGWPRFDRRALYGAAVPIGLAFAHDARLAVALGAAAAPSVVRVARAGEGAALGRVAALVLPGALAAAAGGLLAGAALGAGNALPTERLPWLAALALVGAAVLRAGVPRRVPVTLLALLAALAGAAWLGSSALPLVAPLVALVAAVPAWLLASRGRGRLQGVAAITLAALSLLWLREGGLERAPQSDAADRALAQSALDVEPRTLLLLGESLSPLLGAVRLEQGARPDLITLGLPTLDDARVVRAVTAAHPDLTVLLRDYVLEGELSSVALQSLAARRPIALELDDHTDPALYPTLIDAGLLHAVLPSEATRTEVRQAARAQGEFLAALDAGVDPDTLTAPAHAWLQAHHRGDALYFMAVAQREAASRAIDHAEALGPDRAYGQMRRALGDAGDKPIDVTPWLAR